MGKKLIVDLGSVKEEAGTLIPGIKLFAKKNRKVEVYVVGKTSGMLTLTPEDNLYVVDVDTYEPIRGMLENVRDASLRVSFDRMNKEKGSEAALLSFHGKEEVVEALKTIEQPTSKAPFFAARYPNAYTGHMTLLCDLGYQCQPKAEDFVEYARQAKKILEKRFGVEKPTVKYLVVAGIPKSPFDLEVLSVLKNEADFKGEVTTREILDPQCDVLLGLPSVVQSAISGLRVGIDLYDEYIQYSAERSVTYKIGSMMLKKVLMGFHSGIDRKMTSGGTILMGYGKTIFLLDKDTTTVGVRAAMEQASSFLEEPKK